MAEIRPADFPPPFSAADVIAGPTDPAGERIEVGVLVVGGGPGGLACAIRLGQLLEEHPEAAERLGDVPVALVDKGKQPGSHLLSGAVINPRALRRLFTGRQELLDEMPSYGPVHREGVYLLTRRSALRIPPPPTMRNHGNWIVSVSQLGRWLAGHAEAAGTVILPETSADRLLVEHGRVVGVRTGDKGRGKEGEELSNFEPGADVVAGTTVLAEGCWGSLTGAAIREFDLGAGREPMVWELGVKEIWKVKRPLDRVIHTLAGWPLKISAKYHQIGGSWIYPMKDERTGDDLVSIGFVIDLEYADATTSAHDLLQQFKTHSMVRRILEGGERVGWGAKAIPAGGYWAMPKLSMPGAVIVGDGGGLVNLAALKGVHYAIQSGIYAAEAIYAALTRGEPLTTYETTVADSFIGKDLYEVRNTRQPFSKGLIKGGPLVNLMIATKGRFPGGRWGLHRNDEQPMFLGKTHKSYPKPDGKYTFDKLSSVFITGNQTRDDAPNHIRVQRNVPRELAETWRWMCPAGVYEIPEDAPESGPVDVVVNYTNCVQCGAITAKGGRLTTPEGGDGPLYQIT